MELPHVHAGAVYYNTAPGAAAGPVLAKFRADTEHAFKNYDQLGFKRWFREKSRVLEICYSYGGVVQVEPGLKGAWLQRGFSS